MRATPRVLGELRLGQRAVRGREGGCPSKVPRQRLCACATRTHMDPVDRLLRGEFEADGRIGVARPSEWRAMQTRDSLLGPKRVLSPGHRHSRPTSLRTQGLVWLARVIALHRVLDARDSTIALAVGASPRPPVLLSRPPRTSQGARCASRGVIVRISTGAGS